MTKAYVNCSNTLEDTLGGTKIIAKSKISLRRLTVARGYPKILSHFSDDIDEVSQIRYF